MSALFAGNEAALYFYFGETRSLEKKSGKKTRETHFSINMVLLPLSADFKASLSTQTHKYTEALNKLNKLNMFYRVQGIC